HERRGRFQWQPSFLNQLAYKGGAIGVRSGRGKSTDDVPFLDVSAWQDGGALYCANRNTCEIIVVASIDTWHVGGYTADQSAPGLAAADPAAGNQRGDGSRFEAPTGIVIEKEKGLGTLHHQIVDTHRDQINADRIMATGFDCDFELGSEAIGGRNQNRVA